MVIVTSSKRVREMVKTLTCIVYLLTLSED